MLFFVWMLLPLVLIPLTIIFAVKNSKLTAFLNELLKSGRISPGEYQSLRSETPPLQNPRSEEGRRDPQGMHDGKAADTEPAEITLQNPSYGDAHTIGKAPDSKTPVNKAPTSSASILFGIGITFVILSGFIFSTAIWVYLDDLTRTGILALAALLFFGISALARKRFFLNNTSLSFYMLGMFFSAITFITAGYFTLFGKWLSVSGNGRCLFFALTALIVTGFSFLALQLYRKKFYLYTLLYSAVIAAAFLLGHASRDYSEFALYISLFAAAVSAIHYYVGNKTGRNVIAPVTHVLITIRVLFFCMAFPLLILEFMNWSVFSWLICSLFLAELSYYGTAKNSKVLLSLQSITVLVFCLELCILISKHSGGSMAQLIFTLFIAALTLSYRYRKFLYTICGDLVFMMSAFINSILLLHTALFPYGAASILILEALLLVTALSSGNIFRKFIRIFLPLPLFLLTWRIAVTGNIPDWAQPFCICAGLFTLLAFLYAHISKKDNRFVSMKYSLEFFAGIALILSAMTSVNVTSYVFVILLSIILFAEFHTSNKNMHSLLPLFALFIAMDDFIYEAGASRMEVSSLTMAVSLLMCGGMTLSSRLLYAKNFHKRKEEISFWDTPSIGILLCPCLIHHNCMLFGHPAKQFLALAELSVFAANLHRKEHNRIFNSIVLTVSAVSFSFALVHRPFFVVDNAVIDTKISLLIFLAFGYVFQKIWQEHKALASGVFSAIQMLAYLFLLFDGLMRVTLLNTLLILSISLAILLTSFIIKRKRWFIASAVGLVGLTLYVMKDFLAKIDWWVYLLLVGILLISIATANEYFKSKGKKRKKKAGRLFEDWTW